ncbi:MAG: hypothetical protein HKN12_00820 [Gemmatimonadetes bacterium]|nr:hypothetical protein [Gemmatimonadota bacterium]
MGSPAGEDDVDGNATWGAQPPKRPRPGSGRAALARKARERKSAAGTRPTAGQKASTKAARRAIRRTRTGKGGPSGAPRPIQGAATELRRFSRLVEQKIGDRQRLRHILLALAGMWVIWTFALGEASLPKLWAAQRRNAALAEQIEALSGELTQVRAQVIALDDPKNPQALEEAGRLEYGLIKDGEKLVKFYTPSEKD